MKRWKQTAMKNKTVYFAGLLLLLCGGIASCAAMPKHMIAPDQMKFPELEFRLPASETVQLENGMLLFFLQDTELPLVKISMITRTGSMYDPADREGVAELTAYLMRTGGTKLFKSADVDRRLDALAASPAISMQLDSSGVSFSFLKDDLDECLQLLSQMLMHPAFEEDKFQLALSLKREEQRRITDNPQRLAFREFNRLLYPDDPRGRYATQSSLSMITRDDLIAFHREYFFPSNMMIAVSGDVSKQEAVDKISQYFPPDTKPLRPAPGMADPPKKAGTGAYFIKKDISQSTAVIGELTIGKNDPDYHAFLLLDFIVGSGGFSSRIFSAVRNEEGLAYSAGSFYRARANYGVFGAYALTKTDSTLRALDLIETILREVRDGGITQKELEWAKISVLNHFVFSFESADQIASQQMSLAYEGLPLDYLSTYRNKIQSVTLDDIKRTAVKHLNKEKRLMLILGDADQFGRFPEAWGQPVFISPQP
jgi:predicted Zn-dependent peptidase